MESRKYLHVLSELGTPVFLANFDARGSQLTLHVHAGSDIAALRAKVIAATAKAASRIRVSVRAHNLRHLAFPSSLEQWLKRFAGGEVIHDPTMIVARARRMLSAANYCRSTFPAITKGVFFDPDRRTLFVHLRAHDAAAEQMLHQEVANILNPEASAISVQLVTDLPRRKMIPVDATSASLPSRIGRLLRRLRTPGAAAIAIATLAVPAAAHTSGSVTDRNGIQSTSTDVRPSGQFGVLYGLSVFADGQLGNADEFSSSGLRFYFGEKVSYMKLAQNQPPPRRRARDPDVVGQVGGGGGGAAGPGS